MTMWVWRVWPDCRKGKINIFYPMEECFVEFPYPTATATFSYIHFKYLIYKIKSDPVSYPSTPCSLFINYSKYYLSQGKMRSLLFWVTIVNWNWMSEQWQSSSTDIFPNVYSNPTLRLCFLVITEWYKRDRISILDLPPPSIDFDDVHSRSWRFGNQTPKSTLSACSASGLINQRIQYCNKTNNIPYPRSLSGGRRLPPWSYKPVIMDWSIQCRPSNINNEI